MRQGLVFDSPEEQTAEVVVFGDASFAIEKSQTGTVVKFGGSTVAWRSQKQPQVAKSTADSKVTALASSVIVGEYVKALLESMLVPVKKFGFVR